MSVNKLYNGKIMFNNDNQKFTIIYYKKDNSTIKFEDGTILTNITNSRLRNCQIKNPMEPRVFNIGFIGIGEFKPKNLSKCYNVWCNILRKVKDNEATIYDEWLNFQFFAKWYILNNKNNYLIYTENNYYKDENCIFVDKKMYRKLIFLNKNTNNKNKIKLFSDLYSMINNLEENKSILLNIVLKFLFIFEKNMKFNKSKRNRINLEKILTLYKNYK